MVVFDPNQKLQKESSKQESERKQKMERPSRRNFLKGMAVGAGAVALSPLLREPAEAVDIDVFAMKPSLRGEKVPAGRISHDPRKCVGCRVCVKWHAH